MSRGSVILPPAGGGGGDAFTIIQPITGTSPTASGSDTLTNVSGDDSISCAGNSSTNTLDWRVVGKLALAGGTMSGNIDMGTNNLINATFVKVVADGYFSNAAQSGYFQMCGDGRVILTPAGPGHEWGPAGYKPASDIWWYDDNTKDIGYTNYYGVDRRPRDVLVGSNLSVGVLKADRNANALFEVDSTTKGSFPHPRMTTAQRTAMSLGSGDDGLHVYDTDLHGPYFWNGAAWKAISYT